MRSPISVLSISGRLVLLDTPSYLVCLVSVHCCIEGSLGAQPICSVFILLLSRCPRTTECDTVLKQIYQQREGQIKLIQHQSWFKDDYTDELTAAVFDPCIALWETPSKQAVPSDIP